MKKQSSKRFSKIYLAIFICLLGFTQQTFSQFYHSLTNNNPHSPLYLTSLGRIGLGLTNPQANFHVSNVNFETNIPVATVDIWDGVRDPSARITFLSSDGDKLFGIKQTSTDATLLNYFQNPIVIGNVVHTTGTTSQGINATDLESYTIGFNQMSGPSFVQLEVHRGGINIRDKTTTSLFQLQTGAGEGKILISDNAGNGIWTDPKSVHDDDWIPITPFGIKVPSPNIYLNEKYSNAGIGTRDPQSKLHVVDGNIMISRSASEAPGSRNGSILFGKVVDQTCPLGEWGIEYQDDQTTYINGGLNFWKVYTDNNSGGDHYLFLKNNGNVGINTDSPEDKFQVNSGATKLAIGSAAGESLGYGTSYLGLNASRQPEGWTVSTNSVQNGGAIIYGDVYGGILFSTLPSTESGSSNRQIPDATVYSNVKMKLTPDGKLGIGTVNPICPLDIIQTGDNYIPLNTPTANQVGIWAQNSVNGFGWMMNGEGVGELKEMTTPILSFKSGRIAIGNINVSELTSSHQLFVERGITTAEMNATGHVMIGDISNLPTTPEHKLYVENGITTEEVKVKLKEVWSDYVFNEDYELISLESLQEFITTHKHLPEVPDANQVQKDGIELGQMNALLLKKIEELTLYIINQQKQINDIQLKLDQFSK